MMLTPDASRIVDAIILSFSTSRFQKVAMVIGKSVSECEKRSLIVTSVEIWERLAILVENGKLQAVGDISEWRFSEVKLP